MVGEGSTGRGGGNREGIRSIRRYDRPGAVIGGNGTANIFLAQPCHVPLGPLRFAPAKVRCMSE